MSEHSCFEGDGKAPLLCLFSDSLDPSGVGEHMIELGCQLQDLPSPSGALWRVAFVLARGDKNDAFLERASTCGMQVLALDLDERGLPSNEQLKRWLEENPCALFHAHAGIGWEGHEAIFVARQAGCAIVRTEHLPYLLTDASQIQEHRAMMGAVDRLICVSRAARDSFLEQGFENNQVRAVRNGIVPQPFESDAGRAREDLLRELDLPQNARLLLTVGRFTEQKGHKYLLRALSILDQMPARADGVRLLWVGQGREREPLQLLAREIGVENRVLFLGHREDVASLLRASDAFVLPSIFEGLPLVALEAMASGLPIIGTRVCGTEEAIGGEKFGWLVPPRDPHALALAISQVLGEPDEARQRAQRAQERFASEFHACRMAEETARLYRDVLRERAQSPASST